MVEPETFRDQLNIPNPPIEIIREIEQEGVDKATARDNYKYHSEEKTGFGGELKRKGKNKSLSVNRCLERAFEGSHSQDLISSTDQVYYTPDIEGRETEYVSVGENAENQYISLLEDSENALNIVALVPHDYKESGKSGKWQYHNFLWVDDGLITYDTDSLQRYLFSGIKERGEIEDSLEQDYENWHPANDNQIINEMWDFIEETTDINQRMEEMREEGQNKGYLDQFKNKFGF